MDLFKWALKLWPLLPSEKMADALELAVSCRMLVSIAVRLVEVLTVYQRPRMGGIHPSPGATGGGTTTPVIWMS